MRELTPYEQEIAALERATTYKRNRTHAPDGYPDIGDQLDAIWKQLNYWRLNGQPLIQEADDLLNQILSVKNQYPKDN